MKTRFLTLALCIIALFSVDLAYGYHPISPYVYCNNNPVRYVDPDGMDWYSYDEDYTDKDGKTQIRTLFEYREERMSNKERNGGGYTHLGYTYTDKQTGTYYSLLGQEVNGSSEEGQIWQKVDQAMIRQYTYEPDQWNNEITYEVSTDFSGIKSYNKDIFGSAHNLHRYDNSYGGATMYFQVYETGMRGRWDSGSSVYQKNNHYGVKLQPGYNSYVRVAGTNDRNIITLTYPTLEHKQRVTQRINKLFGK